MAHREGIAAAARDATWTMPAQPMPRQPSAARRLGWIAAAAGIAAVAAIAVLRLVEEARGKGRVERAGEHIAAARELNGAAAVLALSVLADSGIEHYRGAYRNPAMYVAPLVSAVSLVNSLHAAIRPESVGAGRFAMAGLTLSTGLAGLAFHVTNVARREGGVNLLNLFYGAPLLAPGAIAFSGLAALAAAGLAADAAHNRRPMLLGRPAGTVIGAGAAGAMLATTVEAALLHFRGAFHNPFMYVPVSLPPAAGLALAAATVLPQWRGPARWLLRLTAAAGVAGAGFHVYGVGRNMGGFYNWSQNILNGPPIPAPPSFTGVALAGLAAVRVMERA